jgi:hypothetical protein
MVKYHAFALTFFLSIYWGSRDLLESAVLVAIVYGIFGLMEIVLRAWIKRRRKKANA